MPRKKRGAMRALYYFCRAADDAVDNAANNEIAKERLAFWCGEIDAIYSGGKVTHPITKQLAQAIINFDMPQRYFVDMLQGFALDCNTPVILANWQKLEEYCYRVAGCVGLQAMRIFGHITNDAEDFAKKLGLALQLTNILRDITEDAKNQRCYIPQDLLQQINVTADKLFTGKVDIADLSPALDIIAQRAEEAFRAADYLARKLPIMDIMPALLMRDIYRLKLRNIRQARYVTMGGYMKISDRLCSVVLLLYGVIKYLFAAFACRTDIRN